MRILEICTFSAGICGVWARVKEESAKLAKKGYEVRIFSSNATKGNDELACEQENFEGVKIKRFSFKKLGGESFMNWAFEKEALEYSPDIILAHSYRHMHAIKALKIAKILTKNGKKCMVFLVTHAPFERNETRTLTQKVVVYLYDRIIAPKTLNKFDKIIAITLWEIPYLLKLGVKKEKIAYIPNGIPEEFFKLKKQAKEENKILFLGRISPIKNLETAILAMNRIKDKKLIFEIVGPEEKKYKSELIDLIKKENLESRIKFSPAIYDIKKKIKKIDSAKIFILPSKSEGMPQSLIEAMARGKMAVASDIPASKDLIKDGKNGFLFRQGDSQDLARKIDLILSKDGKKVDMQARNSVKQFSWSKIIKKIEALF